MSELLCTLETGPEVVFWNGTLGSFDQCGFVPGECCALIELGCDLAVQLPDRPSSPQRFSFIKDPRLFAFHSKQALSGGSFESLLLVIDSSTTSRNAVTVLETVA